VTITLSTIGSRGVTLHCQPVALREAVAASSCGSVRPTPSPSARRSPTTSDQAKALVAELARVLTPELFAAECCIGA